MPESMKGTLNRNSKGDNPKRPDWRGSINIGGTEYWISAWERTAQRGDRAGEVFLSLSVEEKQARPPEQRPPEARAAKAAHGVPDSAFGLDDTPF